MANRNKKSMMKKDTLGGFTIIEVVLVLAIAGLIFMMVFIALPQLQRAQRDTQRRTNLSAFQSAVTQYQANNNGKIPGQTMPAGQNDTCTIAQNDTTFANFSSASTACRLIQVYLNSAGATENTFTDPDGSPYNVSIIDVPAAQALTLTDVDHVIYMVVKGKCDGETVTTAANPRDYAVLYKLEGSGTYCSDNQ